MKSFRVFGALIAGFLWSGGISPALAVTHYPHYTHYTNASCQVFLTLSTNQVMTGGTLGITAVATGYRSGYTTPGPSLTIPVEVLLDGEKISTLSAPWHPNGVTPVTSSITNLTIEGSYTVTIQHTNDFEYYNETFFVNSVFHDGGLFGSDWYDDYYNVYHYRTVPCSAAEDFTVVPLTAQTISFSALPDKQMGDAPFTLSATASSGLPVSYTSSNPDVATLSGDTVTITGSGDTTITASQAGDETYLPASDVNRTLHVTGGPYLLIVNNGIGSGSYTNGEIVAITASNAPSGQVFDFWTGATQYVASITSATTMVTMPAQDIAVTAAYRTDLSDEKAITEFRLTTANSGTLVNGPGWVSGKYGNGLSLVNGQYVTVPAPTPDVFNVTGDLTIALWVNPNSVTCSGADPAYALVSKRSANHATPYELFIGNGGFLALHYWGTNIQWPTFAATGTITTGAWQHVAVTRSFSGTSATITFYINGVETGSSTAATGPALGSADPVWISRDGYHTGYTSQGSYSGLMDEVQIYNRALSASEISRIYSNNSSSITGRVGNWGFDENSGTTAFDKVADGIISEGTKTVAATVPVGIDVTALVPRITVSPLAAIDPLTGVARNFSSPVTYTVTAEDSTTQNYTVWVTYAGSDIDGNGLPDEWELDYFGIAGVNPNAICSNGVNALMDAYTAGFSPTDPGACFSITGFNGSMMQWNAVSGRVYSVYWTTNLTDGFQPLESNYTGGTFTDSLHGSEQKGFYKIDVRLAP